LRFFDGRRTLVSAAEACEVWSVQGQLGTCVTSRHPPPNLGRNLFPPRRFSYHTRVSRFNGTA
jgi:hypothetical protein